MRTKGPATFLKSRDEIALTISGISGTVNGATTATFTFGEAVTLFTRADIGTLNARVGDFSGSGTTYTAVIVPIVEGTFELYIGANQAVGATGSVNSAATATATFAAVASNALLETGDVILLETGDNLLLEA